MSTAARPDHGSGAPPSHYDERVRALDEGLAREDPATRAALLGLFALAAMALPWLPLLRHSPAGFWIWSALSLAGLACSVYACLFAARALANRTPHGWRAILGLLFAALVWSALHVFLAASTRMT